jgi:hypothetical protein
MTGITSHHGFRLMRALAGASVFALFASGGAALAQNPVVSGAFNVERPTLKSLGLDWVIEGDDNRNASVALAYRKRGDAQWRRGMPLLRLHHEDVNAAALNNPPPGNGHPDNHTVGSRPPLYYKVPNMFSGSVLGLEPDTEYEVRLTLTDPDGVTGQAVQEAVVRTRKEPMPAAGGRTFHVYPWDHQGPKQEPWFTGLNAAYYMEARHADWSNASPPRVRPGDVILVHAGVYKDDPHYYGYGGPPTPRLATSFDGTYYLTVDGEPDRPIVIKGAGDGEVIFDGGGNAVLFDVSGADHTYFEGITVRNTDVAFLVGRKRIVGSSGFTLKRSKIENVGRGVHTDWSGSKDLYIADNLFIGRHPPDRIIGWTERFKNFPGFPELINGPNGSEYAVKIYGEGHVVAYNNVVNWHDGIDVATYGDPDGAPNGIPDRMPLSVDIYGNDISKMGDNCIETDGSARNVRVFENRCFNAASGAMSAQTIFGGPAYFIRNIVYSGVGGSLKFSITPTGVIVYNNTFVTEENNTGLASNVHFRNNLFISHGVTSGPAFAVQTMTNYSSSDYNGFYWPAAAKQPIAWNSPPAGTLQRFDVLPETRRFDTLAALRSTTGQEKNGRMVGADIFQRVSLPGPDIQHVYAPADYDFRLKPRSAAVNAGTIIPNVTDGFAGTAPDLGAIELGGPMPHYGVRPAGR